MRKMKILKTKFAPSFAAVLIAAAVAPHALRAQSSTRLFGELTVIKTATATATDAFVTVDGVRASSGRTISSPTEIVTPPDASAKITLAQTGTITVAPNTSVSLSFVNSSIAGDLARGEMTIETFPNTNINIFTREGGIWTANRAEKNTVKISVTNGETRINVTEGQIMFNKVIVSAGESFPQTGGSAAKDDDDNDSRGVSPLLIAGIAGAVAAAVIIALTVSSSSDDDVPVLSPTR